MEEIVYLNGSLVPRSQARISVDDHGFLYGYGLFETMRAYHGRIFLLERHIKRLLDSAEIIGLGSQLGGIDLGKACSDTLRANGLEDARVRLTVSCGESDAFPWIDNGGMPTVVVTARPYAPLSAEVYSKGFKVRLVSLRRDRSVVSGIKSASYLVSVLARREAEAAGLDEALLLNDDGFIAEGGSCNVFFVRSSRLVTPSLGSGILPGITRDVVMELTDELGISVTEGTVGLATLRNCDEAFFSNSIIEIMPVVAVSDHTGQMITIGSGKPGEVTKKLMAAYQERVAEETGS
jgi:branched-chain amino acid aminotransferase